MIAAKATPCATCRLRHGELLDAAQFVPDRDELGLPAVTNGLSLCKIHHAAYDGYLIGISRTYEVRVDQQLLEEVDGPMLQHPRRPTDVADTAQRPPRRDRLAHSRTSSCDVPHRPTWAVGGELRSSRLAFNRPDQRMSTAASAAQA